MTSLESAKTAYPVFYRTYSRTFNGVKESYDDTVNRVVSGLLELGNVSTKDKLIIKRLVSDVKVLPSGRWMWVGGTDWIKKPSNFYGAYNCSGMNLDNLSIFPTAMSLAMQGVGTGTVLEKKYIEKLPIINNSIDVKILGKPDDIAARLRQDYTTVDIDDESKKTVTITVGDSREGWCDAYRTVLDVATSNQLDRNVKLFIYLGNVRPKDEPLKGFGGVANPIKLRDFFIKIVSILNAAVGRQLSELECCKILDNAAILVVAGNIRRCLPENTLVHTIKGLIPIKDIEVGELVQTPEGYKKVTDKFYQGKQDVVITKTNSLYMKATPNHRVAIMKDVLGGFEWKMIKDLTEGDRLLFSNEVLPGKITNLPMDKTAIRPEHSTTVKNIIIPNLDAEIAWFIGFLHGNGCVKLGRNKHNKPYGQVSFSSNGKYGELLEAIKNKLETVANRFGLEITHSISDDGGTYRGVICSIRFAEYLSEIKQTNQPIRIPSFILQGTPEIRSSYLAGVVDSDGAINNNPITLVTTIYKEFRDELGSLYASLGIPTRIGYKDEPKNVNWKTKHSLSLIGFRELYNRQIACYSCKGKLKYLKLDRHAFSLTKKMMKETYSYSELVDMGFNDDLKQQCVFERYIEKSGLELNIPITYEGVEKIDVHETYDIEVEDVHCFYADGFLTHNSANIRQFESKSPLYKTNLWKPDDQGNWRIDPERDELRMSNHTRVYHKKPSLNECVDSVRLQYESGEGAIQYAPEAIARANDDLLGFVTDKEDFINAYEISPEHSRKYLSFMGKNSPIKIDEKELDHRMGRYSLNPCGEIIGQNFLCNLSEVHLNQLDPLNFREQIEAFETAGLMVAILLHHEFDNELFRYSREIDPIVGVSFTGAFDFFVNLFGVDWLHWWQHDRKDKYIGLINNEKLNKVIEYFDISLGHYLTEKGNELYLGKLYRDIERLYLTMWNNVTHNKISCYCDANGLKTPNRCTTVQPAGTKSLLTGASPGWHPPKAQRYIRRITFAKNDPVALACIDYGYSVVPSQSDTDEYGNLLNDPFSDRCTEWLVEIPIEVSWANLPGCGTVDISQLPAKSQFDFYMNVQKNYTTHNTSATIELREDEIDDLGGLIYEAIQNNDGYISAALLSRSISNFSFPRLPFEPISKSKYDELNTAVLNRRVTHDFHRTVSAYVAGIKSIDAFDHSPVACDSDKCLFSETNPPKINS
jgi:ribonucleotide reductase class II